MPTYEYKCGNCNHVFEEFQSMSDEPLTTCPKCGGKVHRIIGSGAGLIFKGSGFYLTDYKKSNISSSGGNGDSKSKSKESKEKSQADTPTPTKKAD